MACSAATGPSTGELDHLTEQEFHGDPVRPQAGSLVYRIPAWDVLGQLQAAGFSEARMHHLASWKHGVLGSDPLPPFWHQNGARMPAGFPG